MNTTPDAGHLPSGDESIAPVTIFDPQGNVLRVVSAADFRQAHPTGATSRSQPAAAVTWTHEYGPRGRALF